MFFTLYQAYEKKIKINNFRILSITPKVVGITILSYASATECDSIQRLI